VDTASTRLRIANRIHFALLRQYGEHVEVGNLLKNEADSREALWVCEASGDAELTALARQFRHANRASARTSTGAPKGADRATPRAAAAPQDAAWAQNTSGFGVSRDIGLDSVPALPAASSWLRPSNWLRRTAHA
jgi:hypothetical protein